MLQPQITSLWGAVHLMGMDCVPEGCGDVEKWSPLLATVVSHPWLALDCGILIFYFFLILLYHFQSFCNEHA